MQRGQVRWQQPRLTHEVTHSNYASKVHSPEPKSIHGQQLYYHMWTKVKQSAAMEMEVPCACRNSVIRRKMIEQLMIAHEEARKERESLVVELHLCR